MKVCLLIRSLDYGGAERQLVMLAQTLNRVDVDVHVVVFYDGGALLKDLYDEGVKVVSLGKRMRWDVFPFLFRLIRTLRKIRPDILHGYLDTANVLGILAKPILPNARVVWGVRASYVDWSQYNWLGKIVFRLSCKLSHFADVIIVNSNAGRACHINEGYPEGKFIVVPNGIDTEVFIPAPERREALRRSWQIARTDCAVGLIGRLDPMKDHPTFIRAAALLLARRPGVRFVCVGEGSAAYAEELRAFADSLGVGPRLRWIAASHDMVSVYNALDIVVSSSLGEGFPNVIGEAMSCGVPCVVTDVGDSAWVVDDTGLVVKSGNPEAMSDAWDVMLDRIKDHREATAARARQRITEHFNKNLLIERTLAALRPSPVLDETA